jgi:hypothetical protein
MCLVTILPFLVGADVPEDNDMWRLYLQLRELVDLIFADSYSVGVSVYLKCKVEDHNSLFRKVFPEKNMLPKHHLLLHYPDVMRKVGPLSRCSSMRFEAKHYESKRLCAVVCCFKDICKTVVKQHQLNQCVRIAAGGGATYRVNVDRVQQNIVNELVEADCILSSISGLQRFDISHTSCVEVCGTEYRNNMVIVLDVGDEPLFAKIDKCLIVFDDHVYFVCQELLVVHYDYHMHAYSVKQGAKVCVVNHRALKHYKPLSIHKLFDKDSEFVVFD